VKQTGIPTAIGVPDAAPQLPGAVGGLPDAEIYGLLPLGRVFSKIRVAGDLPPVTVDFRVENIFYLIFRW
jgi:hypothetical protein